MGGSFWSPMLSLRSTLRALVPLCPLRTAGPRWFQSPLRQFGVLPGTVIANLEAKGGGGAEGIGRLLDMDSGEVGALCHNHRMGETVGGEATDSVW